MDRFSEDAFRRYEPYITHAIAVLPNDAQISPDSLGLSGETVACRLRDSMRALRDNPQWETSVDRLRFNRFYPNIEVARDSQWVIVRLRRKARQSPDAVPVRCPNVLDLQGKCEPRWLRAFAEMCHFNVVQGLRLVNAGICSENITAIIAEAKLDVAVLRDGDDIVLV